MLIDNKRVRVIRIHLAAGDGVQEARGRRWITVVVARGGGGTRSKRGG